MIRHLRSALAVMTALIGPQAPGLESQPPPAILEATGATTHLYPDEVRLVDVGFDIPLGLDFVPERIVKGCSCLTIEGSDVRGAPWPGGSHHVVSFGFAAGPVTGSMLVRAWIIGRVGDDPRCIVCALPGEVATYIDWPSGPDIVDLGDLRLAELPREFRVALKKGGNPQRIDALACTVSSHDGLFDCRMEPAGTDAWTMTVTVRKLPLSGVITAGVTLTCSDQGRECSGHPANRLRINLIGPLRAKPTGILFGNVPQGQREVRIITVDGAGPDDLADITASDAPRVSWRTIPGTQPPKLEVTFSAHGVEEAASGHLDIHQRDGLILRIPYFARVAHGLQPTVGSPVENPGF
jgi:hypothetical protein